MTPEELLAELRRRIGSDADDAMGVWCMVDFKDGDGPQEMEITGVEIQTDGALVFRL